MLDRELLIIVWINIRFQRATFDLLCPWWIRAWVQQYLRVSRRVVW